MPYMVMVAHGWDALTTSLGLGISAHVEPEMPRRWIPVFDTLVDAEAWADGRYTVHEIAFTEASS